MISPSHYRIHTSPQELISIYFKDHTATQIVAVVDTNTRKHCYPLLANHLPAHRVIELPAGEEYKNLDTCRDLWQQMTDFQLDRQAVVVVIGGGVIGDLAGFCAATYKRGINFVLIPTTLLAQVDASIGGKMGVDFNHLKNHIGVFQLPLMTLISPAFLRTLSERELRSGFAEVIKHCLIGDAAMWDVIRNRDLHEQDWETLVAHSAALKTKVIEEDPHEKGIRKALNFGHSIGHALESYFLTAGNRIFHGEAIAVGMIAESHIGMQKGLITEQQLLEISGCILKFFGKLSQLPAVDAIRSLLYQDKKNSGNKILMALTRGIGQAVWNVEVREEEIDDSLRFYKSL